jgi:hypothetical protein
MFQAIFQALAQFIQSILQMMTTIFTTIFNVFKMIFNKLVFLMKVGFALLFIFIKAIFYKENKMDQKIIIN